MINAKWNSRQKNLEINFKILLFDFQSEKFTSNVIQIFSISLIHLQQLPFLAFSEC